jgi:hypothetical protein
VRALDTALPPPDPAASAAQLDAEDAAQEAQWDRLERGIHIAGDAVPPAVYSFEAMPLPPPLLKYVSLPASWT